MDKVLYVGVFRDGTGYSQAAINYLLALDAVNVPVVPRTIKLNNVNGEVPARFLELENQSVFNSKYVIQHILPHLTDYNGKYKKNITAFCSETSDFNASTWTNRLNLMDEVWVPNSQQKDACKNSNVNKPTYIIQYPCDINKYQKQYQKFDKILGQTNGTFMFYTIGEFNRRKNFVSLLKAFHSEFHPNEPVSLVIKTGIPGLNPIQSYQKIRETCQEVKRGLKIFTNENCYKEEIVITEFVSNEEIMRLHATCDCFVQTSYGESWSIPAFDAMCMGKTPIVTDCTGYKEYIDNEVGWLVKASEVGVFGAHGTFADLYTGKETWWLADHKHLCKCMRDAYENRSILKEKGMAGFDKSFNFSYHKIGTLMRERLYGS